MWKNKPACHILPIFWYKTVNNSWTKKDIKNRQHGIGENITGRKWGKFQDQDFNRLKLKKKKIEKTNTEKSQVSVQLCTENECNLATLMPF